MHRKFIALVLVALLAQAGSINATPLSTGRPVIQDAPATEEMKVKVSRAGVGEKARVTVKLKDGTKIKGYVSQAREEEFVVRDRKTDEPTIIRYQDVTKIENNRGHSTAKAAAIGIGAGVGAVFLVLGILFATVND